MSGGFFIQKKKGGQSREEGLQEMRKAMGLAIPETPEEEAARLKSEFASSAKKARIYRAEEYATIRSTSALYFY